MQLCQKGGTSGARECLPTGRNVEDERASDKRGKSGVRRRLPWWKMGDDTMGIAKVTDWMTGGSRFATHPIQINFIHFGPMCKYLGPLCKCKLCNFKLVSRFQPNVGPDGSHCFVNIHALSWCILHHLSRKTYREQKWGIINFTIIQLNFLPKAIIICPM